MSHTRLHLCGLIDGVLGILTSGDGTLVDLNGDVQGDSTSGRTAWPMNAGTLTKPLFEMQNEQVLTPLHIRPFSRLHASWKVKSTYQEVEERKQEVTATRPPSMSAMLASTT